MVSNVTPSAPTYDPSAYQWGLPRAAPIVPVRVGMDRRTGKMILGWDHVVQSISTLFMTRFHERVLRRWVGSFVPHLLGQRATPRYITRFYWAIAGGIDLWEPDYRVEKIDLFGTTPEPYRQGHMTTRLYGVYRPKAHLGDLTPEQRKGVGLIGQAGAWGPNPAISS